MTESTRGGWVSVGAVAICLTAWEAICRLELVSPVLLSSPSRIAVTGFRLLRSGALDADLLFTFEVFSVSVATALVAGVAIGFAMGFSPWVYHALNPFIVVANSLPKIVLMPLIVLWIGISMSANVFLGALMASFPIIISVFTGVRGLDHDFVLLARSFGAGRWLTLRAVVIPGVTPFVLAGARVGISYAMVGVLIAEFFGSNRGTGYRMVLYMSNFRIDEFFVCIVIVAAFTLACVAVVHRLERRVEAWRPAAFRIPGM